LPAFDFNGSATNLMLKLFNFYCLSEIVNKTAFLEEEKLFKFRHRLSLNFYDLTTRSRDTAVPCPYSPIKQLLR